MASRYIFQRQFSSACALRRPMGAVRAHATRAGSGHRDTPDAATTVKKVQSNAGNSEVMEEGADISKEAEALVFREIRLVNSRINAISKDNQMVLDELRKMRTGIKDEIEKVKDEGWQMRDDIKKVNSDVWVVKADICKALDGFVKVQDEIMVAQDKMFELQDNIRGKAGVMSEAPGDIREKRDEDPLLSSGKDQIPPHGEQKPSRPGLSEGSTSIRKQVLDLLRFVDPGSPIDGATLADVLNLVGDSENHPALRKSLDILVGRYGKDTELLQAAVDIQPYLAK